MISITVRDSIFAYRVDSVATKRLDSECADKGAKYTRTGTGVSSLQSSPIRRPVSGLLPLLFVAILIIGLFLFRPAQTHLRVVSVFLRSSNPQTTGLAVRFARHPFREETGLVQAAWGPLTYRLYIPLDAPRCGGVVLLHGIQRSGMDEPRFVKFSRALAAAGAEVMTPQLSELADYRVTTHTSDEIGYSAEFLSSLMHKREVGVVGFSFAGGLALLAAANPQHGAKMGFLLTVGAHDDLARVARFLATGIAEMPGGSITILQAHEYSALLVAYSHVEDFFSTADTIRAREALKLWLSALPDQSKDTAKRLTPEGKVRFDQLLYHREQVRELLLESAKVHANEMAAVSPSGHLQHLTVPVYLLHAAADNVIPPSEALWLSYEVPKKAIREVLISPAIVHADVAEKTSILQKWKLLHFLAHVLNNIDELENTRSKDLPSLSTARSSAAAGHDSVAQK